MTPVWLCLARCSLAARFARETGSERRWNCAKKKGRAWAKDRQKEREGENAERQGEGRERGGTRKEGQRGRESWERTAREPLQRLSAAKKRCEREC